jgi:hypothetical protein
MALLNRPAWWHEAWPNPHQRLVPAGAHAVIVVAAAMAVLAVAASAAGQGAPPSPAPPPGGPSVFEASVAVRSGDLAPTVARIPGAFGGHLGFTSTGGRLFSDRGGSALFVESGGVTRVVAYAGEALPDVGGTPPAPPIGPGSGGSGPGSGTVIESVTSAAAAADGSIHFLVQRPWGGQALLRLPAGGGPLELLLQTGLPSGGITSAWISSPAVDGAGRSIVTGYLDTGASVLLRIAAGAAPEILLQSGDPLDGGIVDKLLTAPAANTGGVIAFAAQLVGGAQVMAVLAPGSAPVVLQAVVNDSAPFPGPLEIAPPAINDAGDVAFLWSSAGEVRLQRVSGGVPQTIVAPGTPAPGGGTFTEITSLPPAIDPTGGVVFGAYRSSFAGGVYRWRDSAAVLAEEGGDAGGGRTFGTLDLSQSQAAPAAGGDGTILFAATDTDGNALFSSTGAGSAAVIRSGTPLGEPARFVSFSELNLPFLSAGPFLSPAGRMIFDTRLNSGARGLFTRGPDGALAEVALDGDPAPGGGHFGGDYFAFHSVNDDGTVAFLGAAPDSDSGSSLVVYYGPATGPLTRLIGFGDSVPGSTAMVSGFEPPSRVNAAGALAIPAFLSDGAVVLLGWDGSHMVRVAGPGDVLPGQGAIQSIILGGLGALLPPLLDDAGNVTFGAITVDGRAAIYEAPLVTDGFAAARRVLGDGDLVEGGVLTPFNLELFDRDADGRLASQVAPSGATGFATFVGAAGAVASRVAGPGDTLAMGTVGTVFPHLALGGRGRLAHEFQSTTFARWLLLSTPAPQPGSPAASRPALLQAADFTHLVLVGPGLPSPDGGAYILIPWGSFGGSQPYARIPLTDRLASDGRRFLALAAMTTAGPQEIVLLDLDPNHPPVADAGPDQVVECAGPAGTVVTLDGSKSSDPDGDLITYSWSGPFGTVTGPSPVVTLPLGVSTITLTVTDARGASSSATVVVTVRDSLPPTLSVIAIPNRIWPPDGRMVTIFLVIRTADVCDRRPSVTLTSVTISDPKGADPAADIAGAALGTDDRSFQVRAKRSGGPGGRTYTATYASTDHSGNSISGSATILVPQSQTK